MKENEKKAQEKEFQAYIKQFTPKPKCVSNCIKAFIVGGLLCLAGFYIQKGFMGAGIPKENAGTLVTVILICGAQLLTGIGIFDTIAKFAGAGVIVPITGFANSMVSPAIEYKQEGKVLGAGAKLFTVAGPVLVCGISLSILIGFLHCLTALLTA